MDYETRQMHRRALVVAATGIFFGALWQASLINATGEASSPIRPGGSALACASTKRPPRRALVVPDQPSVLKIADRALTTGSN